MSKPTVPSNEPPHDSRPASRKRLIFIGLYVIATIIFIAASLEITVRILGLAPPLNIRYPNNISDPILPFRPKPHFSHTYRSDEFVHEEKHNSMGYRDIEHPMEKFADTFRILALGDSFTWGAGAAYEETYLVQLEHLINERQGKHPAIEIIKAGIYAFFPEPERLLLESEGLDFEPDLILVAFYPNDVQETALGVDFISVTDEGYLMSGEARDLGATGRWLYKHSHAARIPLQRYITNRMVKLIPQNTDDIYRANGEFEEAWLEVELEFERMGSLAAENKSKLVICYIPDKDLDRAGADYPPERLEQWSKTHGIQFINLLPPLRKAQSDAPDVPLYWSNDAHCTPAGYAVIAKTLFEELTARNLIP